MSVSRVKPNFLSDNVGSGGPSRASSYSDAYSIPLATGLQNIADEGSYFSATNATVGTGIAGHAAPVVADTDTKALLHIFNNSSTKNIVLDYVFLEVTAAGTAGTITYAVVYLDNTKVTAKSSGGTVLTPANNRSDGSATTSAVVTFGAVVTVTGMTKIFNQIIREVIPVVQDTVLMKFGGVNAGERSALATSGTATSHVVLHAPPIVIAPGGNFNLAHISPSQSAARSYQVSLGYWER